MYVNYLYVSEISILIEIYLLKVVLKKKIQCKICYKKFRRKWNLEQHVKRIHRENSKGEDTQLNDKDEQDDSEEENEELDKLNDLSSAPK